MLEGVCSCVAALENGEAAVTSTPTNCRCFWCHAVRARSEIIYCDDRPICRDTACKEEYYASTRPRHVPRSVARFEHG